MDYSGYSEEEITYAMNAAILQLKILLSQMSDVLRNTEIYDAKLSMDTLDGMNVLDSAIIALSTEYLLKQGYSEEDIIKMTEAAKKAFGFDTE